MERNFTTERLAAAILFVLLFLMAVRVPTDPDTWWHLAAGEYQIDNGTILNTDVFSHTKTGEPWINVHWLAQCVIALFYRVGGDLGLAIFTASLATGGMAFVYRASPGNTYVKGLAMILGAATAAIFWSPRSHMFSFLFSAIILYLLLLYKWKGIDRLWAIPVVVLVWVNMHGGFVIAFIFMGGLLAGESIGHLFDPEAEARLPWRGLGKLALVMAVSAAALVINPHGLSVLRVPFETVQRGVEGQFIQEWASPDFHNRQTWPFIVLLLGTLSLAGLSKKRIDWAELVLVCGMAFMALTAARNIALFAVVATPVFIRHLDAFLTERGWQIRPMQRISPGRARLNWALLGLSILAALAVIATTLDPENIAAEKRVFLPLDVTAYLNAERPEGLMFNAYNWGGYLMFAAPDYPVYTDSRTDLYGDEFLLNDYMRVVFLQDGWREVLDERHIGFAVIETGSFLANALRDEPGWQISYEDEQAILFEHTSG